MDFVTECEALLAGPVRFVVYEASFRELDRKIQREQKTKLKRERRFLQQYLAHHGIAPTPDPFPPSQHVDDALLAIASEMKVSGVRPIIATNDKELRARARARGIGTLYLRGQKYLEYHA